MKNTTTFHRESIMTANEFVIEMCEEWFPRELGPWIKFNQFDPLFTREELRQMRREGIIVLDEKNKRFRLNLMASKLMGKLTCNGETI